MIVSTQSTKTEQNSPIKDVEIELVGNKSRVILHDNIAQEERETDDGNKYIAYTADEVSFYYDGKITAEDVRADFAAYWYFAEHGETKEERYNRLVAAFVREKYSQNAVEAIINNYLAFYIINEEKQTVIIVRFLYKKSNWSSILQKGFSLI